MLCDEELAADLSAECFAAALLASERFRPGGAPAIAWLFGIAQRARAQVQAPARRGSRAAVEARIVDEREYEEIARELQVSEAVVRKRVSRGLEALRRQVGT
jgi:RNA polymerase sigma-70 factor (ECF subfamily)